MSQRNSALEIRNQINRRKSGHRLGSRKLVQKAQELERDGNPWAAQQIWSMLGGRTHMPVKNQRQKRKAMRRQFPHGF